MPCAYPIPARRGEDFDGRKGMMFGRDVVGFSGNVRELGHKYGEAFADDVLARKYLLFLPCGACVGCQLSRARSWAIRNSLELSEHLVASFVTLTYAERSVPPTLLPSDLGMFFRSLRKRWMRGRSGSLRVFGCGEYGEERQRPHYHALLYGCADEQVIQESWPHGFATASFVNPARISYTAGYCAKKVGLFGGGDSDGYAVSLVDNERFVRGEAIRWQKPFLSMSRRPGIGGAARQHWRSWRSAAIYGTREVPVPRFLHASYLESASESEKAQLLLEKKEREWTLTLRELVASEAIAETRVAHTMQRRKL